MTNEELKIWLQGLQPWLSKAAHLLLSQGSLSDADIDRLVLLLKAPPAVREVFEYPDIISIPATRDSIRIDSIGPISGIEKLSPRTPLLFGSGNLTVIYGHNGSGKSGYSRILKSISGKNVVPLRSNVFQAPPPTRHCTIAFKCGNQPYSALWSPTDRTIEALRVIDVFDTTTGEIYLTKENEATYLPYALGFLEKLATSCGRVAEKLNYEKTKLVSKLPTLPVKFSLTATGSAYKAFAEEKPSSVSIQSLLVWTAEDNARVESLETRLSTHDPLVKAKEIRGVKKQVDELVQQIVDSLRKVSTEECVRIRGLQNIGCEKRNAATEGVVAMVSSAKIQGVGELTWRKLWEAAREYALIPYTGKLFPNVEPGAKCVLCHQDLDADARARLTDFERYIKSKLESDASDAEKEWNRAIAGLPKPPAAELIQKSCELIRLSEDNTGDLFAAWAAVWEQLRALEFDAEWGENEGLREADFPIISWLKNHSLDLELNAAQFEQDAKSFNRDEARREISELRAKEAIAVLADAIREEIAMRASRNQYTKWIAQTNTASITKKVGEVTKELLTEAYVERFNRELNTLGATHIQAELRFKPPVKGVSSYQIHLSGLRTTGVRPSEILSEGERRIVALAAFFADVTEKPQNAPFVFDDPISSLDHDYEWNVACRLTTLAKERQVIVLTHRLSLYGAFDDAAQKEGDEWKKRNLKKLCIESCGGSSGHPVSDDIATGSTSGATDTLIARLNDAKAHWDRGDSSTYKVLGQSICSDFRKLVERTVEEDLIAKVVLRHRRSITTDNRIGDLAKITSEDCRYFDGLMTKYSAFMHSQSTETAVRIPDEPDLRTDLQGLKDWRIQFKRRAAAR